jgi:hypothetical protein
MFVLQDYLTCVPRWLLRFYHKTKHLFLHFVVILLFLSFPFFFTYKFLSFVLEMTEIPETNFTKEQLFAALERKSHYYCYSTKRNC